MLNILPDNQYPFSPSLVARGLVASVSASLNLLSPDKLVEYLEFQWPL